jgi:hypothetical protein
MRLTHDLIQAVKEMMERNWDVWAIADKMNLDPTLIQTIIDIIQGTVL